jgi:hypothetical protein
MMAHNDRKEYMQSTYDRYNILSDKQLDGIVYSNRCSDCSKWMTKSCPREQPGTGKRWGFSQGPSAEAWPCQLFNPNWQFEIALECQLMRKLSHDL